jgi:large subunit ribosomal protein L21
MRAIIETGGKQFTVAPEQTIRVPTIPGETGQTVTLDRVLYAAEGSDIRIGDPHLEGATVTAEIVKHGRDRKIIVYKAKRRKRHRRKQGHRQNFTELRVTGIEMGRKPTRPKKKVKAEKIVPSVDEVPEKVTETESPPEKVEEKPILVCEVCGKEYKTERGLNNHMAKIHAESEGEG